MLVVYERVRNVCEAVTRLRKAPEFDFRRSTKGKVNISILKDSSKVHALHVHYKNKFKHLTIENTEKISENKKIHVPSALILSSLLQKGPVQTEDLNGPISRPDPFGAGPV